MKRMISTLIVIAFLLFSLPQDLFASDTKNAPSSLMGTVPFGDRDSPHPFGNSPLPAGVSAAKFDALNQKQIEAVAFKNALAASQAPQGVPNKIAALQNTYPDGKVIQTIDGIDFVNIEERRVIRQSPSRNQKLKAFLRGRKAHAKYIEVVTNRVVGRAQDGSEISNIALDAQGRITGYTRTKQQNLNDILFDIKEDVSGIAYDANGRVLNRQERTYLTYSAPAGVIVLNIQTDPDFKLKGYDILTSQNINGVHFAVSKSVSVSYSQTGQAYATTTSTQLSATANDGRSISNVRLNKDNLVSGYTEKRKQSLAGIQFDLEREVRNITYDKDSNALMLEVWLAPKYTARDGVEISDIKADSSLRVQGYKVKQTNKAINKQLAGGPDETQTLSEISDITYDSNNKVSSLTLASFRSFEITYAGGGYAYKREQIIRGVAPNKLTGIQAEIYTQLGIPVVHLNGQFSQDALLAIQKVLRDMYPAHLLDEVGIILGQLGERQNVGDAILVNTGGWATPAGVVMIFGAEAMDVTTLEDVLVHELAHTIHFKEMDIFKAGLRDEFARLHDVSGDSPADLLNYNDTSVVSIDPFEIKRDPKLVPEYPAYGMENLFEDFATMMQGWFWNSLDLLKRGIGQFSQWAKEILLKKALILAQVFSHTIDGIEYTYTYTLKDSPLGDFIRECSRIIRNTAGKITKIGDTLIPNL